MSPSLVEDFDGGKGLPTYVEVNDTDVELETSKAAPKARADKGKGRARAPIPLGSPIDIDDDEPVVPKKKVSATLPVQHVLTKLQPVPRPLFAKAASTKATQEANKGGPPAPSGGDMASVAFLRGHVGRLAEEVGHLEGQVVQAEEELTEEKAAGARLRQRVRRLEEELEEAGVVLLEMSDLCSLYGDR